MLAMAMAYGACAHKRLAGHGHGAWACAWGEWWPGGPAAGAVPAAVWQQAGARKSTMRYNVWLWGSGVALQLPILDEL